MIGFRRTYLNIIYLLLDFALSFLVFSFILISLTLGFGTLICWIGIPILLASFASIRRLTLLQGQAAARLLGLEIDPGEPAHSFSCSGMLGRLKSALHDKSLWSLIVFHLRHLFLTMTTFTACVALVVLPLCLLLCPLLYSLIEYSFITFRIATLTQALVAALIGLPLAYLAMVLLDKMALSQGAGLKRVIDGNAAKVPWPYDSPLPPPA